MIYVAAQSTRRPIQEHEVLACRNDFSADVVGCNGIQLLVVAVSIDTVNGVAVRLVR